MLKIIILILSILFGFLIDFFCFNNFSWYYQILITIGFTISFLISLIILFFILFFFETIFESKKKKRTKQSKYYRNLLKFYSRFLLAFFSVKVEAKGIDKLNKDETYLIISNHRSNIDSLIIDLYLKDFKLIFIAKKSLFKIPFVGRMIHGCGYINLDRDNLKQEYYAIKDSINYLTLESTSVGVFPEGTRTKNEDYTLNEFKAGTFSMAKKSQKPIVLSALRYTDKVNEHLLLKKHKVYYDIIEVVPYTKYKDMTTIEIAKYCKDTIEEYLKRSV